MSVFIGNKITARSKRSESLQPVKYFTFEYSIIGFSQYTRIKHLNLYFILCVIVESVLVIN